MLLPCPSVRSLTLQAKPSAGQHPQVLPRQQYWPASCQQEAHAVQSLQAVLVQASPLSKAGMPISGGEGQPTDGLCHQQQ